MAFRLTVEGFERAVEVGWGGHAVVFRAWQTGHQREVAIKVLSVTPTPDTLERFEAECAAIGTLSGHPNVVAVHDVGATEDGRPFIVMEYLHGGSLGDALRGRGPFPWEDVAEIGVKLAGALHTAHLAGVLHRDVKPENVLVSRFGEPKLGDFGVARLQGGPATGSTGLVGSLPHAAPEVLGGGSPTVASDIYSLGSTLYTLLAGTPPFAVGDEGLLPLLERVSTQPPPDLRTRGVPDEMCLIIEQALAKDPGDRQLTAEDVGRQLQTALGHAHVAVPTLTIETPTSPAPRRRRRLFTAAAAATSLAVLAAATMLISTSEDNPSPSATPSPRVTAAATSAGGGGVVAVAAEGGPACADWLAVCAGQAWGTWTMYVATMPRMHDIDARGRFQPTELLARAPILEVGPPQRVTYEIRADAVWSDGQPITSHDLRYSWQEIMNAPDVRERAGYDHIATIDDSNPKVAVVTFREPYGAWRELFGVRPALLPSHLLEGKDRPALMKDGYQWSGGAWLIDRWTRGSEIRLIPNPRFWATKPRLDAVVFRLGLSGAALVSALRTGQVQAAYPTFDAALIDQLEQIPGIRVSIQETLGVSGIWLNTEKPILASRSVRQALIYAIDREGLLAEREGGAQADLRVLQALVPPALTEFYVPAFARYSRDVAKVDELMWSEGWTKGPDGIWTKDDQRAAFEIMNTAPRGRDLLLNQWREAGFDVSHRQAPGARLFGELLPRGEYDMVGTGLDPITDAGLCFLFCSHRIPTPANNYSGLNTTRISSPVLDELWTAVDHELDDTRRAELVRRGHEELAREVPLIPLSASVRALVTTERIGGRVEHNLGFGPFLRTNEWFLQQ